MLHHTFNFWEQDQNLFFASDLHRLLRRIDLMFNSYLREIYHKAMEQYLEFI